MRSPLEWWRDKRDPFRELEPIELFPKDEADDDDDMDTSFRDRLERDIVELGRAEARGGVDEVMRVLYERVVRERDDIRFARERKVFGWTKAGTIASVIAAITGIAAGVLGVLLLTAD